MWQPENDFIQFQDYRDRVSLNLNRCHASDMVHILKLEGHHTSSTNIVRVLKQNQKQHWQAYLVSSTGTIGKFKSFFEGDPNTVKEQ